MSNGRKRYRQYLYDSALDIPERTKRRWNEDVPGDVETTHDNVDIEKNDSQDSDHEPGLIDDSDRDDNVSTALTRRSNDGSLNGSFCGEGYTDDDDEVSEYPRDETAAQANTGQAHFTPANAIENLSDVNYDADDPLDVELHQDQMDGEMELLDDDGDEELLDDDDDDDDFYDAHEHLDNRQGEPAGGGSEDDQLLFLGATVTKKHLAVLLLRYTFKHHLTGQALEELLGIWDVCFPGMFFRSKYLFQKYVPSHLEYKLNYYCEVCSEVVSDKQSKRCPGCDSPFDIKEADKKENYFASFPLEPQLRLLLEDEGLSPRLRRKSSARKEQTRSDIINGDRINDLMDQGHLEDDDLTLLVSLDGASPFRCSDRSFWPILVTINELDPTIRNKHVLMLGLWLGKGKPNMDTYLLHVMDESLDLVEKGFVWTKSDGQTVNSHVFFTTCTADAPAQAVVRNCNQFNGCHGCPRCYTEGVTVEKGAGTVRVYPNTDPTPDQRSHIDHFIDVTQAIDTGEVVKGVKPGVSPLMTTPNFDMVTSFVSEYMHCLQNVMKNLLSFWFDSKNHNEDFYIGRKVLNVDRHMRTIKPPNEITRSTPIVSARKRWKAAEFRAFCVHYGPIVLKNVLQRKYYDHFLVLSWCVYTLLNSEVSVDTIAKVETALVSFVKEYEELYGMENVTHNVHQLTHMADTVRQWGPLWAYSMYPFEGMNHILMKLKKGTQHCVKQVASAYVCMKGIQKTSNEWLDTAIDGAKELDRRMAHIGRYKPKSTAEYSGVRAYGRVKLKNLSIQETVAISELIGWNIDQNTKFETYERFSIPGMVLHVVSYRNVALRKRQNSLVQLENKHFGVVVGFVILDNDLGDPMNPIILLQKCEESTNHPRIRKHGITVDHIHNLRLIDDIVAVSVDSISRKCIALEDLAHDWFSAQPLPNQFETD